MQEKTLILVVEDNPIELEMVSDSLEANGYEVLKAQNGEQGMEVFSNYPIDLIILDVVLPEENGFDISKKIRAIDEDILIIFLTSKNMKDDEIQGFTAGADDYISKPFDNDLLLARIKAILKRAPREKGSDCTYELGKYTFDCKNMELKGFNEKRRMTKKEADIFKILCANLDKIVKREDLVQKVWGENSYFNGRSLDVFMTKLRKYIKDDEQVQIKNIHGVGFSMTVNNQ